MNRNSSAYLFCLVLIMTVFCSAVPGMTMENGPGYGVPKGTSVYSQKKNITRGFNY